jgi:hypothetical protein
MLMHQARRGLLYTSRKLATTTSNMAKLDINSTYRLNSGYNIPLMGYGVSLDLNLECAPDLPRCIKRKESPMARRMLTALAN